LPGSRKLHAPRVATPDRVPQWSLAIDSLAKSPLPRRHGHASRQRSGHQAEANPRARNVRLRFRLCRYKRRANDVRALQAQRAAKSVDFRPGHPISVLNCGTGAFAAPRCNRTWG
jgi:hypothetical protein